MEEVTSGADFDAIDKLLSNAERTDEYVANLVKELQESNKIVLAVKKGEVLNKQKEIKRKEQLNCNHRKGGFVVDLQGRVGLTQGSEPVDYCVIKHTYFWGDTWVRCIRCGKTWKPGVEGYQEALLFPTRNQTSSSIQLKVDVEKAREATKNS